MGESQSGTGDLESRDRVVVAIVGGAVAGSEAAAMIAERGGLAVVIERNDRPYGKIEEGLPRWHRKLRRQEYKRIDANLDQPGVWVLPQTALARQQTSVPQPSNLAPNAEDTFRLEQLTEWGFSAVLLANGAWKDRSLPVPGIDAFLGRGFAYQNAFVRDFNRDALPELPEGAIVVGGGLASVDVAKILSLETHRRALAKAGHAVSVEELERQGIVAWCKRNEVPLPAVKAPRLLYRRGKEDMALVSMPADADDTQRAKVRAARKKIMSRVEERYRVQLEAWSSPVEVLEEDGRLAGLRCVRNVLREGRLRPGEMRFDLRSELVVSSIGSTPEQLMGVPIEGELYPFVSERCGTLLGRPNVFGLGNVLTGRGNIRESRLNAQQITRSLLGEEITDLGDAVHEGLRKAIEPVVEAAMALPPIPTEAMTPIRQWVQKRWNAIGYAGYADWIARHPPPADE